MYSNREGLAWNVRLLSFSPSVYSRTPAPPSPHSADLVLFVRLIRQSKLVIKNRTVERECRKCLHESCISTSDPEGWRPTGKAVYSLFICLKRIKLVARMEVRTAI